MAGTEQTALLGLADADTGTGTGPGMGRLPPTPLAHHLADFANVVKSFLGSNFLALPFAFASAGLVGGSVLLAVIAFLTDHCCQLLIKCKKLAICRLASGDTSTLSARVRQQDPQTLQYGDIAEIALGKHGRYVIDAAVLLTQFGFCVGYCIFLGNTIHSLSAQLRPEYGILIVLPVFMVCAFINRIRDLGLMSVVANLTLLLGFVLILTVEVRDFKLHPDVRLFNWEDLPIFFGIITGGYEAIGTVVPIESSMLGSQHLYPAFQRTTIVLVSCILGSFGLVGYMRYGPKVSQFILDELSSGPETVVAQVSLVVAISLTYPLQLFPVTDLAEGYLGFKRPAVPAKAAACDEDGPVQEGVSVQLLPGVHQGPEPRGLAHALRFYGLRIFLVGLTGAVAVGAKSEFGYWGAFCGSLGSSALTYIIPPLIHMRLQPDMGPGSRTVNWLLVVFGALGGLLGLYSTISSLAGK